MTTILPSDLDYTATDQESLEERLLRLVPVLFHEWGDTSRAQFGNVLVRLPAYIGDRLTFLLDNNARESRYTTASLRFTLLSAAKMMGYSVGTSRAATVTEVFSIPTALPGDVTIPAGRRVQTAEVTSPISYQLLTPLVIPAGQISASAIVENSVSREQFLSSSGLARQIFRLDSRPYIDGTMVVTAGQGAFVEVETLRDSTSTDRHFEVITDDQDRPIIRFGDGVQGAIPFGTIRFGYRIGGGRAGRVDANTLTRIDGAYTDTLGNVARVSVNNPEKSVGGDDREANAEIKANLPRAIRTHEVLVGIEDYEFAAEQVSGVARALHLPDTLGPNQGWVFIVTDDLTQPSQGLIDAVEAQWGPGATMKKLNTYRVYAQGAPLKVVNVTSTLYLSSTTTPAKARANIEAAVKELFSLTTTGPTGETIRNPRVNFGRYTSQALAWSDAFNAVRDAAGVQSLDPNDGLLLNGERANVELLPHEFPKLGSITLVNAATGDAF